MIVRLPGPRGRNLPGPRQEFPCGSIRLPPWQNAGRIAIDSDSGAGVGLREPPRDTLATVMNSLDLHKAPEETRVVVAMSGGVDSSVVAALLKREGYDVVGITLQLYDHGAASHRKGACCAGQDIHDARAAAEHLGIPHYVLDYEDRFRESVIDRFAESYLSGETPIPYSSSRCPRISRTVIPRAYIETILSSKSGKRRWSLAMSFGSNVPARSRGTSSVTFDVPVSIVFLDDPLRRLMVPAAPSLSR